ncbi:MAG: biotin/lipoyl-binding protein, partial [Terracidiphilus sp.]
MSARNRVFMILGLLFAGSLAWYWLTARPALDLHLIGTVDANEVEVSSKIMGRVQQLLVQEGDQVQAGQLIAVIESQDLAAAEAAAQANVASERQKLNETVETERQTKGEVSSATLNSEAQVSAAEAALEQARANLDKQKADTTRTVALAKQGIMSEQSSDEAVASLEADQAAVDSARHNVAAAQAALEQARAHELQA